MNTESIFLRVLMGLVCALGASFAQATVIGFNLNIIATESASSFGTGVTSGEVFTGTMYFDSSDISEGEVVRSVVPGGDTLNIAGVSLDSVLNDTFWFFYFVGGLPVCIEGGVEPGCNISGGNPDETIHSGTFPGLDFSDDLTGVAYDGSAVEGEHFAFTYSFSAVPEPTILALLGIGSAGLGFARRRAKA